MGIAEDMDQIFKEADGNEDGLIDFEEFETIMRKMMA